MTGNCLLRVLACRRDEALAAIQESIMKQQQQELAIETEIQGYKKDIVKEQVRRDVGALYPRCLSWHMRP